jgi:hypothetical protein
MQKMFATRGQILKDRVVMEGKLAALRRMKNIFRRVRAERRKLLINHGLFAGLQRRST